jgi:hypothetical protein
MNQPSRTIASFFLHPSFYGCRYSKDLGPSMTNTNYLLLCDRRPFFSIHSVFIDNFCKSIYIDQNFVLMESLIKTLGAFLGVSSPIYTLSYSHERQPHSSSHKKSPEFSTSSTYMSNCGMSSKTNRTQRGEVGRHGRKSGPNKSARSERMVQCRRAICRTGLRISQ